MDDLDALVTNLRTQGVEATVWVDGSFLTRKLNPADVDVAISIAWQDYSGWSDQQKRIIDSLRHEEADRPQGCHIFAFLEFPPSHVLYWAGQAFREYWLDLFGHDRSGHPKGVVVVEV